MKAFRKGSRLSLVVFVLVVGLALPALAAARTVTMGNGCTIQGQNGSGINTPWAQSNDKGSCTELRARLNYWNGTNYVWKSSGWVGPGSFPAYTNVTGISTYSKSEHGGNGNQGSRDCLMLWKTGEWLYPVNCG